MNIALIGPSGVGKGTHSNILVERFNFIHLVTGELFRENLENRTAVGFLAKRYLSQGELVPDEVVDAMVAAWLWKADPQKGVLFDGFPRTIYQAQFLDILFDELGRHIDAVIYLKISDEEVTQRLSKRVICQNCHTPYHLEFRPPRQAGVCDLCGGELLQRPDDIPEMVRVRLRAFRRVIGPVLYYYQESDRLILIDGEGSFDQVSSTIVEAVETVQRQEARAATSEETSQIETAAAIVRPLSPAKATHRSFDLVLVGGPGSGKGTQAEQLKNHLEVPHIASGDLFRENLKNQTELGKLAKTYMDRGELVPDDVTEAMVEDRISRPDAANGFILDGFPRTLSQAQALTEMLNNMRRRIDGVLYIRVSDEEIVKRLSGRLICRDCQTPYHLSFKPPAKEGICDACGGDLYQRDDDNPKTVRARLKTFHDQTAPIINYYRDTGVLVEINGEGEVSSVTVKAIAAVKELRKVTSAV
jgi:adenylate kinase